jgi:hypothetical protein
MTEFKALIASLSYCNAFNPAQGEVPLVITLSEAVRAEELSPDSNPDLEIGSSVCWGDAALRNLDPMSRRRARYSRLADR